MADKFNFDKSDDAYNEPEDPNEDPKKAACKRHAKQAGKTFVLFCLVVVYAIAGSYLFQLMEMHEDIRQCEERKGYARGNVTLTRIILKDYIINNATQQIDGVAKPFNETVIFPIIDSLLTQLRDSIVSNQFLFEDLATNCEANTRWGFSNTLLFCITVFTTIGYGHITPKTWEGQLVCIAYAMIGVPLFLICLANLGAMLGAFFRFMYAKVCCRVCIRWERNRRNKKNQVTELNKQNPQNAWKEGEHGKSGFNPNGKPNQRGGPTVVEDDEEVNQPMHDEDDDVTIPLTVSMMIITVYILIGALMFSAFEGWTQIEAAYFSFITLATIGFGDFVPGQNSLDTQRDVKLAAGCVYMFLGMATVGMCFSLMQEEIIAKFNWIAMKIGLVEEDELLQKDPKKKHDDDDSSSSSSSSSSDSDSDDDRRKTETRHGQKPQHPGSGMARDHGGQFSGHGRGTAASGHFRASESASIKNHQT